MLKRFLSVLMAFIVMFCILGINPNLLNEESVTASAVSVVDGNCYAIKHVGSGKYLDINRGGTENGQFLQIWPRNGNDNQNFTFLNWGSYWTIVPCHSNKVVEVRNSSRNDSAPVAQWEYAGIACQEWIIVNNSDGTVSFRNRNSGKYLDVQGNGKANGTRLIQYRRNNTTAQRFKLEYVKKVASLRSGSWTRSFSNSDIKWTQHNLNTNYYNYTRFSNNGAFKYPTPGYSYLYKYEYIDAETVHKMLVNKSLNKSTIQSIKDVLSDSANEYAKEQLLKKLGFGELKGTGIVMGILETLATEEKRSDWNKFANTTQSGKGILKITYLTITTNPTWGPLSDGTGRYGWRYNIVEGKKYEYRVWDGKSMVLPLYDYKGGHITINYNYRK